MPVQTHISGLIGAFIGGTGGALVLFAVYTLLAPILKPGGFYDSRIYRRWRFLNKLCSSCIYACGKD
jgi:tetrahydromethanopterin S-methyltransferase subunit D